MTVSPVLDAAGMRRSPATIPGYHAGRPPRNKGQLYPADPPAVEEIIAVMRKTGDDRHGFRLRGRDPGESESGAGRSVGAAAGGAGGRFVLRAVRSLAMPAS